MHMLTLFYTQCCLLEEILATRYMKLSATVFKVWSQKNATWFLVCHNSVKAGSNLTQPSH